jgi:GNAT superfamily N-acetyltransferase
MATLEGNVPGKVYVDDTTAPRVALLWVNGRLFLVGTPPGDISPGDASQIDAPLRFLNESLGEWGQQTNRDSFVLHYHPPAWSERILAGLAGRYPISELRHYYTLGALRYDWRERLPTGFTLRPVDRDLLAETQLGNLERVTEEMCSERPLIDEFLARSFGVCAVHGGEIAGWCMSEYNTADRCEVGIEVVAAYQRRGLATALASALIEEAQRRGIGRIGWHCWARNKASIATALAVGLVKSGEEEVINLFIEPVIALGVHGNLCLLKDRYAEALNWYEQALQYGNVPVWVYINAGNAHAAAGDAERSLQRLHEAAEHGFDDIEYLRNSRFLKPLHGMAGWAALLERLETTVGEK